jgi:hypothetical protein
MKKPIVGKTINLEHISYGTEVDEKNKTLTFMIFKMDERFRKTMNHLDSRFYSFSTGFWIMSTHGPKLFGKSPADAKSHPEDFGSIFLRGADKARDTEESEMSFDTRNDLRIYVKKLHLALKEWDEHYTGWKVNPEALPADQMPEIKTSDEKSPKVKQAILGYPLTEVVKYEHITYKTLVDGKKLVFKVLKMDERFRAGAFQVKTHIASNSMVVSSRARPALCIDKDNFGTVFLHGSEKSYDNVSSELYFSTIEELFKFRALLDNALSDWDKNCPYWKTEIKIEKPNEVLPMLTKLTLNAEVEMPEGWEATGEYRIPKTGEKYLCGSGVLTAMDETLYSHYIILRKKRWIPQINQTYYYITVEGVRVGARSNATNNNEYILCWPTKCQAEKAFQAALEICNFPESSED